MPITEQINSHTGKCTTHLNLLYAESVPISTKTSVLVRSLLELTSIEVLCHLKTNSLLCVVSYSTSDIPTGSAEDFGGRTTDYFRQLGTQLTQWRQLLPRDLQWPEEEPTSFPSPTIPTSSFSNAAPTAASPTLSTHPSPQSQSQAQSQPALDPSLNSPTSSAQSRLPLFTPDLDSEPALYPYVYDIQVALLRTRYYYAKYMVYRPFVYKALHFPERMMQEDAESVAECLRVCDCLSFAFFTFLRIFISLPAISFISPFTSTPYR
jgi:hypothetical protein